MLIGVVKTFTDLNQQELLAQTLMPILETIWPVLTNVIESGKSLCE
jgi:hypothetical protein